ncbi:hypothetical protein GCM10008967_18520 [Bacillus carboniphilus]|uniref:Uncharacterized protein n=1 Tax=Bacillus carboniphilus TaxID=86663 RepID=A0ABN0W7W9_9BACI
MKKWDQLKQLLLILAIAGQLIGIVLLFIHIPSAIAFFVIYALTLLFLFVLIIIERKKEKKEDDENDFSDY